MWPRRKSNIVSVSINPQNLILCWAQDNKKSKEIVIKSYKKEMLTSLEFEKSIVFNPTKISNIISTFIKKQAIGKPIISLAVAGPNVFEKIVNLPTSSPQKKDFAIPETHNINWNSRYLCPSLKSGFDFYVCGMSPENLFQYKLLAIKSGNRLSCVTTERSALLQLYKHVKKEAFTQGQLAIDLGKTNYDLKTFFTPNIISNNITLDSKLAINLTEEIGNVATSIGLFLLGNTICKI